METPISLDTLSLPIIPLGYSLARHAWWAYCPEQGPPLFGSLQSDSGAPGSPGLGSSQQGEPSPPDLGRETRASHSGRVGMTMTSAAGICPSWHTHMFTPRPGTHTHTCSPPGLARTHTHVHLQAWHAHTHMFTPRPGTHTHTFTSRPGTLGGKSGIAGIWTSEKSLRASEEVSLWLPIAQLPLACPKSASQLPPELPIFPTLWEHFSNPVGLDFPTGGESSGKEIPCVSSGLRPIASPARCKSSKSWLSSMHQGQHPALPLN